MRDPFDVPLGNISSHWVSEPATRGTWTIFSTCIITMTLCVWTSLHANIPGSESPAMVMLRKIWLVLIGLFAPELLALAAVRQKVNARELTAQMRGLLRQDPLPSFLQQALKGFMDGFSSSRQRDEESYEISASQETDTPLRFNSWTLTHSHYALMGGYAIRDLEASPKILPSNRTRLTLTPAAILFLAENHPDQIPNLSEEEIWDKSKANSLAKTIVCIQASWFCIQCISRLASGLSISLLELNTFAHSISVFVIYIQWWKKPLDIRLPSIIPTSGHLKLFSAMIMTSALGQRFDDITEYCNGETSSYDISLEELYHRKKFNTLKLIFRPSLNSTFRFKTMLHSLIQLFYTLATTRSWKTAKDVCISSVMNSIAREQFCNERPEDTVIATDYAKEPCHVHAGYAVMPRHLHGHFSSSWSRNRGYLVERFGILGQYKPYRRFTESDQARLEYAHAYRSGPSPQLPPPIVNYVTNRIGDISDEDAVVNKSSSFARIALDTIELVIAMYSYGIIHVIAWNAPFPSRAQSIMWRLSGLTILVPPIAGIVYGGVIIFTSIVIWIKEILLSHPRLRSAWSALPKIPKLIQFPFNVIFTFVIGIFILSLGSGICLYIVARVFLIVECFISVTYIPDIVYSLPDWSKYVPHIS